MIEQEEILNFKKDITNKLHERFPNFEKCWHDIVKSLGNEFVGLMKTHFKTELDLFKELSAFKFSIVIDNNFIFGQIKSSVEKNKKIEDSFIFKLVKSTYIDVYGPYKLRDELFEKINLLLNENKELATTYANQLLEHITIQDAFWIDQWKKANNLIGHIDSDDVPYLALAFHVQSHSIISNDNVFKNQGNSKTWKLQETDKIIASYNSGCISFCFVGLNISILKLIWKTIVAIFKILGDILIKIITGIGMLIIGSVDFIINKIPPVVSISLIAAGLIAAITSEKFRSTGKEILIELGAVAKKIIEKVIQFLQWLSKILNEFWEIFKPIGITTLEIMAYFSLEYELMTMQVQKLEEERAKA